MNKHVNWVTAEEDFVITDVTLDELAELHNSSGRSMRRHCREGEWRSKRLLYRMKKNPFKGPIVGFYDKIERDVSEDKMVVNVRSESISTLEDALDAAQVDLSKWKVVRSTINSWNVTARNRDVKLDYTENGVRGHVRETPGMIQKVNWQVKVWLKPVKINLEETIANITEAFSGMAMHHPPITPKYPQGGLVEISMPDLHLGKLSWNEETGHGDGDLKLIIKAFEETLANLVSRAMATCPSKILFIVGNDLIHVDNLEGTTSKGTIQDVDGRPQKLFDAAVAINVQAIRLLRTIAPVDVLVMPGNHDTSSTWHLGTCLNWAFESCSDVSVDNRPMTRKYYRFGSVLLGFCHGGRDDPKMDDLPLLMMRENQEVISEIHHMEWHIGHKHGRKSMSWLSTISDTGIHVRILPALCVPDSWHAQHGFVGQPRAADMYLWDKVDGYQGHLSYTYKRRG